MGISFSSTFYIEPFDFTADAIYRADEAGNVILDHILTGGKWDRLLRRCTGQDVRKPDWVLAVVGQDEYAAQIEAAETHWAETCCDDAGYEATRAGSDDVEISHLVMFGRAAA